MIDIVDRLSFDATRCDATFSRGVASNIEDGIAEIKRLRAALQNVRNKLHAYNRPTLAQRVRIECRDICDVALGHQQKPEKDWAGAAGRAANQTPDPFIDAIRNQQEGDGK